MEENISRFVTAIIAMFILFIFPVYIAYEKKDDISYALAVRFTEEFVDKVRSKGYLTEDMYQQYIEKLYSTGNVYSVELEHTYVRFDPKQQDENIVEAERNEEVYTTEHILNVLNNQEIYTMNVNDNFNVKIKNTNITMATVLYNIVTVNMSENNVRIYVDYGGNILAEKWQGMNVQFPGAEQMYDQGEFLVEAYSELQHALLKINPITEGEQLIEFKGDEYVDMSRYIYYRIDSSITPSSVTGKIYRNGVAKDLSEVGELVSNQGNIKIYRVVYNRYNTLGIGGKTFARVSFEYKTPSGTIKEKIAQSPTFEIVVY